jgi:heptosyltransferase-2
MIRTDCLYYNGWKPCIFHKKYKIECNDQCAYYKKIGLRILIIKKAALGDVLRTTPILHSIKKKYGENTHITWLTDSSSNDIIKYNLLIKRIYLFDFKTVMILEFEKYDILFNFDKDIPALALSKKVKAKKKFGFTMNDYGNLITFNKAAEYAHRLGINDDFNMKNTKTYPQIISELAELPYSKDYKYILNIPEENKLREFLKKRFKIDNNSIIIGLNTGAGQWALTRRWGKDNFVDLGLLLIQKQKFTVLLFGAEPEKKINQYIYDKIKKTLPDNMKSKIIDTGTKNTLLEFAVLVSLTDVLFTANTLGLHFAIAREIPSVSIYGPLNPNEIELYGTGIKIIANSPCLGCYRQTCNYPTFSFSTILIFSHIHN